MRDVRCCGEIEAAAAGLERQNEEGRTALLLEGVDQRLALFGRDAAVEIKPAARTSG